MLQFYFHPTPNPAKVALMLAELDVPFELVPVDTMKGEQHAPAFRALNPNGKLPALDDDGTIVFDSTAILLYLAEKYDTFLGAPEDRGALLSWLMFIASGLGPFSGQSVHFHHAAPEDLTYAKNRYMREAERHYAVLNAHLQGCDCIVGNDITIADISAWGWIDKAVPVLGPDRLSEFPALSTWFERINNRPAVFKARKIGKEHAYKTERDEEASRALFPSNYS